MDARLHRASRAAALTILIILTTALVSVWATNPPPPESWKKSGLVFYSEDIFDINLPSSSNITVDVEKDEPQNTTTIITVITTELMTDWESGQLSFEMESEYHIPHSRYNITDIREVVLFSSDIFVKWVVLFNEYRRFLWLTLGGLNETCRLNQTSPTKYWLQMTWNSTLSLIEERNDDTSFTCNLDFSIHYVEDSLRVDPALFRYLLIGECMVGIAVTVGLYKVDEPVVIDYSE